LVVTKLDFAGTHSDVLIAQQKANGVSGKALAPFITEMEKFKLRYQNLLFRLPMTFVEVFPVGVLVSLISVGLVPNMRFMPLKRT